jgi:16S rRNA A1518/A1519 N6-dimethyltransferase RsmA/KsgA/DIM1 with predicted DNA glycosylase/AP lyase activity
MGSMASFVRGAEKTTVSGTIPEDKSHELHPVIEILQRLDIAPTRRAETLSVEDFLRLTLVLV